MNIKIIIYVTRVSIKNIVLKKFPYNSIMSVTNYLPNSLT